VTQIANDNWVSRPYRVKSRPDFMRESSATFDPAGWSMFSPEAPKDDGTLVVRRRALDGRISISQKARAPIRRQRFTALVRDQQWCDWTSHEVRRKSPSLPLFSRLHREARSLRPGSRRRTIRSFDVLLVTNAAPPPGRQRSRTLVTSAALLGRHETPDRAFRLRVRKWASLDRPWRDTRDGLYTSERKDLRGDFFEGRVMVGCRCMFAPH